MNIPYKKIGLYFGGFVAFFAVSLSLAWYFTSGIAQSADDIFQKLRAGNLQEVYENTALSMKEETPFEAFDSFVKQFQLTTVVETSWTNRSIKNKLGEVHGTLTYEDGRSVEAKVSFVKEDGVWKMYYLGFPKQSLLEGGFDYSEGDF